ncbi:MULTISPECIES: hypothetical protein [unclassified Streptomyces]|uniref:hypothetical protein n=1 Tax=unclassified Streptomyces TaxID=2593676 RepID=UPI002E818664|nr:hypothetical protein [Streptomyces sp. NBC_00589]WTI38349.1 hypothetical protein OIC96_26850 [Streptomyces sp. NBC_00775]WUB27973.1 hypothetical protein OHA51_22885 [Streptomyces sp. NBC_00589]
MTTRNIAMTAAVAAAAALAATGVTYASAAGAPEAAPAVQQAAPAAAPLGGDGGASKGNEGDGGWIEFNERTYSAHSKGCITVVSGLGSKSFNIRNDSRKTVEVFRGVTCDNGSPLATVGAFSTSNGVTPPRHLHGGLKVRDGVVGSFRVIDDHHDSY